jgi:hypothetical protein
MWSSLDVFDQPLGARAFWKFGLWVTAFGGSFAFSGAYGLALDSFSRLVGKQCLYVSPFGQPGLVWRFIGGIMNGFYDFGNLLLVILIVVLFSIFGLLPRPAWAPLAGKPVAIVFVLALLVCGWYAGLNHTFASTMPFVPSRCAA